MFHVKHLKYIITIIFMLGTLARKGARSIYTDKVSRETRQNTFVII